MSVLPAPVDIWTTVFSFEPSSSRRKRLTPDKRGSRRALIRPVSAAAKPVFTHSAARSIGVICPSVLMELTWARWSPVAGVSLLDGKADGGAWQG